ncbi:MAG: hypothetical protein AB8C84_07555 [Oligoflexales bacterium]
MIQCFLIIVFLMFSCQQKPVSTEKENSCQVTGCEDTVSPINADAVIDNDIEEEEGALIEGLQSTYEKKWTLAEMDNELIVTDPIVGMLDLIGSRVPVLSVESTNGTSYLQVVRCLSSAKIQDFSTGNLLRDIADAPRKDQRLKAYLEFDYFSLAEQHPDCFLLSFEHMSDVFPDFAAPSGQYVYLIRSCLESSLIDRKSGEPSRNCSRYVARSSSYEYVNERQDREQEALMDAQQKRLALRGHSIRIDGVATRMQSALEVCQKQQVEQLEAVKKKQAIAKLIGTTINTAANAFVITKGLGSVASTGGKKIISAGSKLGKAKAIGSAGGSLLGVGMLVGGLFDGPLPQAFVNITAHATDIPRTCYDWEQSQQDMRRAVAQYANAMEQWLWSEKKWLDMSRARYLEEGFEPESLPDWNKIIEEYLRWQASLTPVESEQASEPVDGEEEKKQSIDSEGEEL